MISLHGLVRVGLVAMILRVHCSTLVANKTMGGNTRFEGSNKTISGTWARAQGIVLAYDITIGVISS